ncbi:MAG TPA: hypothetical protein EYP19_11715 [Desulfobacterales bacterium]|nr:hypothetical protein [Desulfobacterales bacterium]
MEKNIVTNTVHPDSTSLEDKEGYAVGVDGVLTASTGDYVFGIVRTGRPAGEASEIITQGEVEARVDGSGTSVAVEDPLTGGADGKLVKATIGTHIIRAIAKEAVTTDTTAQVVLLG